MTRANFALVAPIPVKIPNGVLCGVYFLYEGDEVVYVGQSVNVYARVATHRESKRFTEAACVPVPNEKLNEVESAFIRLLCPRLNRVGLGEPRQGDDAILAPYMTGTPTDAILRWWLGRMAAAFKDIGNAYSADVRKIRRLSKELLQLRARVLTGWEDVAP